MRKSLPIDQLKPGMFVSQVLEQNGPVRIRRIGMVKSPEMIKGLREMGVSLVEVDFSQSLEVDDEAPPLNPKIGAKTTPTARLLARGRNAEQVDRALSQQFHNSLFMPAVEDMPSRWELYARPITLSIMIIICGFVLGFTAMQMPRVINQMLLIDPVVTTPSGQSQAESGTMQATGDVKQTPVSNQATAVDSQPDTHSVGVTEQLANAGQPVIEDEELDQSTYPDSEESVATAQLEPPAEATPILPAVNGITLNEGERVLGYQGESLAQESTTEAPVEAEINPALLAKINQVVDTLDKQPPTIQRDPVVVHDTFPRIDQLSSLLQNQLPGMSFSAHMYATNPQDRWVRVNGRRLEEGDYITDDLLIDEINSDRVVLNFRGQRFTMSALSDWQ